MGADAAAGVEARPLTGATASEHSIGYEGWRVAAAAALGMFVSFASVLVYTFGIFLKPIAEAFSWNRESVSGAFGIAAMTAAVCAPITGMLLDRFGPRRVIVPAVVVFGATFASLSVLTGHLWHYYALFFVFGCLGYAASALLFRAPQETFYLRGANFNVPEGWICEKDDTEIVCVPLKGQ